MKRAWTSLFVLLTTFRTVLGNSCGSRVDLWIEKQRKEDQERKDASGSMLFFLHVPRTAGRSFRTCFLGKSFPPSRRCENSYEGVRINVTDPKCSLLSSHDDFSLTSRLPPDTTLLTQLRHPFQRVMSAYRFTMEVASRSLLHPSNHREMEDRIGSEGRRTRRIRTDRVWPWSLLLPWTREILLKKNNPTNSNITSATRTTNGSIPDTLLTLEEFLGHESVHANIHNNMMYQILGITPYSKSSEASELRKCVEDDENLAEKMYRLAEERLRDRFIMGLTENICESVELASFELGISLAGRGWKSVSFRRKADLLPHSLSASLSGNDHVLLEVGAKGREVDGLVDDLLLKEGSEHVWNTTEGVRTRSQDINGDLGHQKMGHFSSAKMILSDGLVHVKKLEIPKVDIGPADPLHLNKNSLGQRFVQCMESERVRSEKMRKTLFLRLEKKFGSEFVESLRAIVYGHHKVDEQAVNRIKMLNGWDLRLYDFARKLFDEQLRNAKRSPSYQSIQHVCGSKVVIGVKNNHAKEQSFFQN